MPRPTKKRMPEAPRLEVIDSTGPEKVSAADSGPISVTISVSFSVVSFGSREDAQQRDEGDHRGEEGEQTVVRERGRPVGHAVLAELVEGALEDGQHTGLALDPGGFFLPRRDGLGDRVAIAVAGGILAPGGGPPGRPSGSAVLVVSSLWRVTAPRYPDPRGANPPGAALNFA